MNFNTEGDEINEGEIFGMLVVSHPKISIHSSSSIRGG